MWGLNAVFTLWLFSRCSSVQATEFTDDVYLSSDVFFYLTCTFNQTKNLSKEQSTGVILSLLKNNGLFILKGRRLLYVLTDNIVY